MTYFSAPEPNIARHEILYYKFVIFIDSSLFSSALRYPNGSFTYNSYSN